MDEDILDELDMVLQKGIFKKSDACHQYQDAIIDVLIEFKNELLKKIEKRKNMRKVVKEKLQAEGTEEKKISDVPETIAYNQIDQRLDKIESWITVGNIGKYGAAKIIMNEKMFSVRSCLNALQQERKDAYLAKINDTIKLIQGESSNDKNVEEEEETKLQIPKENLHKINTKTGKIEDDFSGF